MIDFSQKQINAVPIERWEVWFRTVRGLHKTLDEAVGAAMLADMNPELIIPIPVALGIDGNYEEVMR